MTRRNRGFTLVELLIAAVLMAIVVMYLMQTFTVQHRTYQVVDHVTEAQQNLRAIAELIERDVRHGGFMVPEGGAVCINDNTNAPDELYVSDADALDPTGQLRPDLGADVTMGYSGGPSDSFSVTSTTVDALPFYDNDADGVADADFRPNGAAIIVDFANPQRGRGCGVVIAVTPTSLMVDWVQDPAPHSAGTMQPEDLIVIPAHVYDVDPTTLRLTRDGQLLAADVEDMQVALFYDEDNDGAVDAGEYPGSGGTGDDYSYTPGALGKWSETTLREVRLNLVARTRDQDPNQDFSEGRFQTRENRAGPAGADRFRRRVHSSTIRIRNVGTRDAPV